MGTKINTITQGKADNFDNENKGEFNLTVKYERDKEYDGNELVELNPLSVSEVEILDKSIWKDGVQGLEGELIVSHDSNVLFELDNDGSLNITDFNVDKYHINEMGELIIDL